MSIQLHSVKSGFHKKAAIICGSRNGFPSDQEMAECVSILRDNNIEVIGHGGAKGIDTIAGDLLRESGYQVLTFPADWDRHGRSAGPIRNRRMARELQPHLVIAFRGGKGTVDMVQHAEGLGIPVYNIPNSN